MLNNALIQEITAGVTYEAADQAGCFRCHRRAKYLPRKFREVALAKCKADVAAVAEKAVRHGITTDAYLLRYYNGQFTSVDFPRSIYEKVKNELGNPILLWFLGAALSAVISAIVRMLLERYLARKA